MRQKIAAIISAAAAALMMAAAVTACANSSPEPAASADASVSVASAARSGLTVGAGAFTGQGRLAFVSGRRLYVLDGTAPGLPATLHQVAAGTSAQRTPGSPAWSPDGHWLAYLVGPPSADGAVTSGALWLAGPDGQGAHQALPDVAGFAWSPAGGGGADELAATSGRGGTVSAVRPGKPTYAMLEVPGRFDGAPAWSPNGRELAVATVTETAGRRFAGSAIDLFVPAESLMINHFATSRTSALIIDAWWSTGEGLLAWADPQDSASRPAAGLPLASYPLDGRPAALPSTLAYPPFAPPAWNGVTLVTGGDRYPWSAKTIEYCSVSGQCGPAGGGLPASANLYPAASTAQEQPTFAFAHCATEAAPPAGQRALAAWYRTCRLWSVAGAGANALPVARAGAGVAAPAWSAGDRDLLYVRDNALWLVAMRLPTGALSTAPASRVVSRLFAGNWPNARGYTAWQAQFAWKS